MLEIILDMPELYIRLTFVYFTRVFHVYFLYFRSFVMAQMSSKQLFDLLVQAETAAILYAVRFQSEYFNCFSSWGLVTMKTLPKLAWQNQRSEDWKKYLKKVQPARSIEQTKKGYYYIPL